MGAPPLATRARRTHKLETARPRHRVGLPLYGVRLRELLLELGWLVGAVVVAAAPVVVVVVAVGVASKSSLLLLMLLLLLVVGWVALVCFCVLCT